MILFSRHVSRSLFANGILALLMVLALAMVSNARAQTAGSVNAALASNGATATSSSTYSLAPYTGFSASHVINGDRKAPNWATGVWTDATRYAYPDWVQINFSGTKTIGEINVFSMQDNHTAPVDPTPTQTFSQYGVTAFRVEYWNGSGWATVPGGNVTGNNLVWRKLSFAPITTDRIRVVVNGAVDGFAYIPEIEAWTVAAAPAPAADTTAPSVPAGLTATALSQTQVRLNWSASTDNVGVTGYYVYLNDQPLTTTTSTTFTHSGLTAGTTYRYRVSAYDVVPNNSAWTATPVAVTTTAAPAPDTQAPSVPLGLTAVVLSSTQIRLVWNPSTDNVGVTGYYVYLNDQPLTTTTATTFTHTGLTAGTTYRYRVSAFDAVPNHSAWTPSPVVATATLPDTSAPTVNVTSPASGTSVNGTAVTLTANASDNVGVVGVQFKLNGVSLGSEVTAAPYSTPWNTASLAVGSYTLTAAARDAAGNVTTSAPITVSKAPAPDTQAPSVPGGLTGTALSANQIRLNWSASTDNVGVTGYYVYLNDQPLTTTTATTFTHSGLTAATTYRYRVSAFDAAPNHSAWTASPVAVTTTGGAPAPDTQAPSVPAGLTANATSSTQVTLNWSAAADNVGVTGYYVYLNDQPLTPVTGTTYTHSGLTAGTTYNYRVSAFDAVPNHSAWTAAVAATTPGGGSTPPPATGYLPVLPGQAGYGMQTKAGRGGTVYKVTNLNASGTGSLRECATASGPRVCVFEVSGNIDLAGGYINVSNPFITIAGQTAPAPGISIINGSFNIVTHDVLVQHIRMRSGLAPERRTPLSIDNNSASAYNVVIDHVSMAWSTDDLVLTWWGAHDITWSNVLATGELNNPGVYHDTVGKVMLTDSIDYNILMKDSALITGYQRMPLAQANPFVFVNNIVYNWGGTATQFMRQNVSSGGEFVLVNNHYRTGPLHAQAWVKKPIFVRDQLVPGVKIYLNGNHAPDFAVGQQWDLVDNQSPYSQAQMQVSTLGAWPTGLVAKPASDGSLFETVLNNVGAFPRNRDSLDTRLVNDARNKTGGFVTTTSFEAIAQNTRALTLPANPNGDDNGNGYTNLEEWLHCMAAQVEGRACQ